MCPPGLTRSNRLQTRTPGGVGGAEPRDAPYSDHSPLRFYRLENWSDRFGRLRPRGAASDQGLGAQLATRFYHSDANSPPIVEVATNIPAIDVADLAHRRGIGALPKAARAFECRTGAQSVTKVASLDAPAP